jgi:DNA-binding transcriptional MerR regulator
MQGSPLAGGQARSEYDFYLHRDNSCRFWLDLEPGPSFTYESPPRRHWSGPLGARKCCLRWPASITIRAREIAENALNQQSQDEQTPAQRLDHVQPTNRSSRSTTTPTSTATSTATETTNTVKSQSSHFKTREVVELLDLSRRQLQYWAKTGLIEPSARTPGGHHRYSFADLVALKATKRLIDAGVSVQKIRRSVRALQDLFPQVDHPLGELVLVATGDVVLVFQADTVFEAISGQEWVFEVADFEREVAAYRSRDNSLKQKKSTEPATDDLTNESRPAKPGPRGTRRTKEDWSQTG